jgi:hypothetical protein
MCNLSSAIEREGIAIGEARGEVKGRAEGNFEATARYFRKGVITAEEAASDLGMTEAEFLEKAGHFEEGK